VGHGVLVAGTCDCESGETPVVVKLKPHGSLVRWFGRGGVARVRFRGGAQTSSIARTPEGKVVVAGEGPNGWMLARLLRDGQPDPSFSRNGKLESPGVGGAEAVALSADGAILAAGTGLGAADTDFEIRRYLP
jgi:Domain of unknown function (DUF5122) beta-propeller